MKYFVLSDGWQWKRRDSSLPLSADFASFEGWIAASVPGTVHQALLAAQEIPDPFLGLNEHVTQWIGEQDWLCRCTFLSPPEFFEAEEEVTLCCDGLDTVVTVWLNGTQILQSDNMFVPRRISLNSLLHPGQNELHLLFESALRLGKEREAQYGKQKVWNGDGSRVYVRKAQYQYGWDWGPTLLTAGPWLPVRLEAWSARIADLFCAPEVAPDLGSASLPVTLDLEVNEHLTISELTLSLRLFSPTGDLLDETRLPVTDLHLQHLFALDTPQLWWPGGYGEQPLYRLEATLLWGEAVLHTQERRLGVRRLRLIQHSLLDEVGKSFFFEINGTPIFCGGANWIPADSFLPRLTPAQYKGWLQLAADAHMKMLRVWGGGIYEDDCFYDLCDELGLLVWQDCMFACGIYPTLPWFQESVSAEVEAQILRLRNHPCIVLWCGNNEDQLLAESLGYDSSQISTEALFPARTLYEDLLPAIFARLDSSRPYWPGSPFGGTKCNDATIGDQHIWAVWHQGVPYQDYYKLAGRFVSEFGMQAYPELATIESFTPPQERYPQSRTLDHHNKAEGGQARLASYLADNLRIPGGLEDYIYATQFVQAEAVASALRGWRRQWKGAGREYVAGALVWQLNDCWPVISWAIVDYWQRPKPSYYTFRREMAPLALGLANVSAQCVALWAVNGQLFPLEGKICVQTWNLEGTLLNEQDFPILLAPNQASELGELICRGQAQEIVSAQFLQGQQVLAQTTLWPEPFKYLALPDPEITLEKLPGDQVRLEARRPARGVWLSTTASVKWSDNMLDLLPSVPRVVTAEGLGEADIQIRWLHFS